MKEKKKFSISKLSRNLFWFMYCGIILAQTADTTYSFFAQESGIPLFYRMLYYFYPLTFFTRYLIDLVLTVVSTILLIPLFFYAFELKGLLKPVWKMLVVIQILLTVPGNTYAKIQLKSYYMEGGIVFWIMVSAITVMYAPFYYAIIRYAFCKEPLQDLTPPSSPEASYPSPSATEGHAPYHQ